MNVCSSAGLAVRNGVPATSFAGRACALPRFFPLSRAVTAALIEHDKVIVKGDIVCDRVACAEAIASARVALIERVPDPSADIRLCASTEKVDVNSAQNCNSRTVASLYFSPGRDSVLKGMFGIDSHDLD